jgi:hypothetical protein
MSKRLQVVLSDEEYRAMERVARSRQMTVSSWVREALRAAQRMVPGVRPDRKIAAVREAARLSYPTGDPAQMLAEIERGYIGLPER